MQAVTSALKWFELKRLKRQHADSLARYDCHQYNHKGDTITVVDAFNRGLLSPKAMLSPILATQVSSFTNRDMLAVWNVVTRDAMTATGSLPPGAIPLNDILVSATYHGETDILDWLMQLKDPSQPLRWTPNDLLTNHVDTAHWAMMHHANLLATDDPHRLVNSSLSQRSAFFNDSWLNHVDKPGVGYDHARQNMRKVQTHAHNIMDLYFPSMPWQERWTTFAQPLAPVSPHPVAFNREGMQGLLVGTVFIEGLLYNAPLDARKCLAAFKRSRHPLEDGHPARDVAPKAIRHAFFGDPAPQGPVPDALAVWLSIMQGTSVQDASQAWLAWHTGDACKVPDMHVPLPDNAFDFQSVP